MRDRVADPQWTALSAFQRDILAVLAGEPQYGLAIKRDLDQQYDDQINHGRLYPNLDDLAEMGLVEKSERDKRTNEYALTRQGRYAVISYQQWLSHCLNDMQIDVDSSICTDAAPSGQETKHGEANVD